jgi:hypothetical protein
MSRETFLSYRNFFYLWANLATLTVLTVVYLIHSPLGGPNGGTLLGYTYGVLAALGIGYLMWYGMRKRSYGKTASTLQGTLAAHVWLGIALLLLVPLHAGFQFGVNVHTLAYVLMVLVIVSGIWGAFTYLTLAPRVQAHRGGGSQQELVEQILSLSSEIERIAVSGSTDELLQLMHALDVPFHPGLKNALLRNRTMRAVDSSQAAQLLSHLSADDAERGAQLVELITKKRRFIRQLDNDVATLYWMRVWLYLHLPLSFALVAAVAIHIFSVFYNW